MSDLLREFAEAIVAKGIGPAPKDWALRCYFCGAQHATEDKIVHADGCDYEKARAYLAANPVGEEPKPPLSPEEIQDLIKELEPGNKVGPFTCDGWEDDSDIPLMLDDEGLSEDMSMKVLAALIQAFGGITKNAQENENDPR